MDERRHNTSLVSKSHVPPLLRLPQRLRPSIHATHTGSRYLTRMSTWPRACSHQRLQYSPLGRRRG